MPTKIKKERILNEYANIRPTGSPIELGFFSQIIHKNLTLKGI